jgi:drug/metabolite transporter (DMT)-like permease
MTPISRTMGLGQWTMLIILSVIWGGSFFFFAIAIRELPTLSIVLARVALGAMALWLAIKLLGIARPRDPKVWRDLLIMGILNNVIPFCLIVWGQHEVASGLAAVINGTTPFFTVLVANAFTRDEKMSWNRLAGALAGLAGVAVMIGYDALSGLGASFGHQGAIVLAAVFYACASVFARRFGALPPLVTAAGQTTGASLVLLPLALLIDQPWTLPWPSQATLAALIGLGVLCTAIAYLLYFTILKSAGAANLVLVTFLVPVSAILLGVAFLGESLKPQHFLGMAAIGLGLALIDGRLLRRS